MDTAIPLPMDADMPTLHIRCGSDIRDKLTLAGLTGDFLEYSDPITDGPIVDGPNLIEGRARTLAAGAGRLMGLTEAACLARLRDEDRRLADAHQYRRVVLWFEHDCYDQLILARCLARLAEAPLPQTLELICIDRHPDVPRFNGLGQLEAPALARLWHERKPVTADQIALGQEIWSALRQPDPAALQVIAETGTPALPIAAPALWRHLQELPGLIDGLSLTQRLVLGILARTPTRIGQIFAALVNGIEPLVFMGDIGLLGTVEAMAHSEPPVLTIEPGEKPFPRVATLTETGRSVLAGELDYLSLRPKPRWVGNVVTGGAWRCDVASGRVVPGQAP